MTQQEKLSALQEFIRIGTPIYSWTYDRDGRLLEANCPVEDLDLLFDHTGCLQYAKEWDQTVPLCLGGEFGILWGVAFAPDENGRFIHVLGPVLNIEVSQKTLREVSQTYARDDERRRLYNSLISAMPVIPINMFQYYILTLHYCLTGEKLTTSDIQYQKKKQGIPGRHEDPAQSDRYQTYLAEKQLLYHVREGNLDYRQARERAASLSNGIPVKNEDPLKQALISTTSFVSLCVRAAIEGGLPPDAAYSVGDAYIQSMAGCKKIPELGALSHAMYDDFVRRVHRVRTNSSLSRPIMKCCEYIDLHAEEELSIPLLAQNAGYTDYYLSRKFKAEVGESINDYINHVRVERAKMYLETTTSSISEIALKLHFCSSTYFSSVFRKITGKLPSKYRDAYT